MKNLFDGVTLDMVNRGFSEAGLERRRQAYLARFERKLREWIPAPDPETGCREWRGGLTGDGYGKANRLGKPQLIHRYVWQQANGPIPPGMFICHHCDNPPCCELSHLFLGSLADNNRDKIKKGRAGLPKGEAHPGAKLTASQVLDIRARYRFNTPGVVRGLAAEYGVSIGTIEEIVSRRTWRHLP